MEKIDIAIVGAGPYGLSLAAHLRSLRVPFRIFGHPMSTWQGHMPDGMLLKSDGFASNLSAPARAATLEKYCTMKGIPYHHRLTPVALDTFIDYGNAFQQSQVPTLERCNVTSVQPSMGGYFQVQLDTGEALLAKRVVLAVGITHYAYTPPQLTSLGADLLSHGADHKSLMASGVAGKDITIIGGGASAIDISVLFSEAGANVRIIARRSNLVFHDAPAVKPSLWKRIRRIQTGIGPGWRSRFFTSAPQLFRFLPASLRIKIVRRHLGPAAGWPMKARMDGKIEQIMESNVVSARRQGDRAVLTVVNASGQQSEIVTDHVISATGYRPTLDRLSFLSESVKKRIRTVGGSPHLSLNFESSAPGVYFVGISSAHTFGPMMRFAFGSGWTAPRLATHLARTYAKATAASPAMVKQELPQPLPAWEHPL